MTVKLLFNISHQKLNRILRLKMDDGDKLTYLFHVSSQSIDSLNLHISYELRPRNEPIQSTAGTY